MTLASDMSSFSAFQSVNLKDLSNFLKTSSNFIFVLCMYVRHALNVPSSSGNPFASKSTKASLLMW